MHRLRTLGGLGVERGGVPLEALANHRKSLLVLVVIDRHGRIGRERLMSLLWPESSIERARGSLKQAVHQLRRQLGAEDLVLGTSELRLNPDRIDSDAGAFLDALGAGDAEAAVARYGGPFLDGVHLDDAGEFERWVDGERDALARRHHEALGTLAREAAARGDAEAAIGWWRTLQGRDPLNTQVALELVDALERAGDRPGALRHGRVHELLLREELGMEPDPALRRRMDELRTAAPGPAPTPVRMGVPKADPEPATGDAGIDPVQDPARDHGRTPGRRGFRVAMPLALGLAGVVGAALLASWLARSPGSAPGTDLAAPPWPPEVASVAVLPLVDMSPDGSLEHWADGLAEEILNTLSGIREIRVPARTSSFHFKGRSLPVREIADLLGVDHVLEGSVRADGGRIRITAQLVDARNDRHLWSSTFDAELGSVFAVQEEIARAVAQALRVELRLPDPTATSLPGPGAEAHELYLKGLFHWHRRSTPDLLLALRHFEEATRLEPDYARAWAGLALVYAVLPITFVPPLPVEVARARLEEVAATALALDPSLAEVHAALGLGHHFDWRWEEAEREFLRALELNPRLATANQWYAEHLAKTGRGALALEHAGRALELDPLSLVIRSDLGLVHLMNRDFEAARAAWLEVLDADPTFTLPHFFLHRLDLLEGKLEGAEEWGRRWAALTGAMTVEESSLLTRAVGDPRHRPAALALLDAWGIAPAPRRHDLAFYRVLLGDVDGALRELGQGVDARAPMMSQLLAAPWFDALRGDPRFEALRDQVVGSARIVPR
jgi:TolB-like protein/DNA-binding SARP family transcriptional activator